MVESKKKTTQNLILFAIVVLLVIAPLFLVKNADFEGADSKAEGAITEINKDYKPWFSPLIEPASSEIESLLFALQASIGALIIGYGIGYMKGSSRSK